MPKRVFICYSRSDKEFASQLASKLKTLKHLPWQDVAELKPGEEYGGAIERAIGDSDAVMVVISPQSVRSHEVTFEWAFAMGRGRQVIPVIHKPAKAHRRLTAIQWIDLSEGKWKELTEWAKPTRHLARDAAAPTLHAEFDLENGKPYRVGADENEYVINLEVQNLPAGARQATYIVHDDTFAKPKWKEKTPEENFASWLSRYGDVLVTVDITGSSTPVRAQDTILAALKRRYRRNRDQYIAKAVAQIAKY